MSITSRSPGAVWDWPWRVWTSRGNDRAMTWHAVRPRGGRQKGAQTGSHRPHADGDPDAGRDDHYGNPTLIELLRASGATGVRPHYRQSGQACAPRRPQCAHGRAGIVDHGPVGSSHASILSHHGAVAVARMAHRPMRRPWLSSHRRRESSGGGGLASRAPVSACRHTGVECHGPPVAAWQRLGARRSRNRFNRYLGRYGVSVSARSQSAGTFEKGWGALWTFLAYPVICDRTFCRLLRWSTTNRVSGWRSISDVPASRFPQNRTFTGKSWPAAARQMRSSPGSSGVRFASFVNMIRIPTVPGVFFQSAMTSATAGSSESTGLTSANRSGWACCTSTA